MHPQITAEALRKLAADLRTLPPSDDDNRLLLPDEVAKMGGPAPATQEKWRTRRLNGWHLVHVSIGRHHRVSGRLYRAWQALHSPAYGEAA